MKVKAIVSVVLFFVMGIFIPELISGNDIELCIGLALIACYIVLVYFLMAPHIKVIGEN